MEQRASEEQSKLSRGQVNQRASVTESKWDREQVGERAPGSGTGETTRKRGGLQISKLSACCVWAINGRLVMKTPFEETI